MVKHLKHDFLKLFFEKMRCEFFLMQTEIGVAAEQLCGFLPVGAVFRHGKHAVMRAGRFHDDPARDKEFVEKGADQYLNFVGIAVHKEKDEQ